MPRLRVPGRTRSGAGRGRSGREKRATGSICGTVAEYKLRTLGMSRKTCDSYLQHRRSIMKLEKFFEGLLWDSRFVVLVAVIASLLASFSMIYIATVAAYYKISHLLDFVSFALDVEHRFVLCCVSFLFVV